MLTGCQALPFTTVYETQHTLGKPASSRGPAQSLSLSQARTMLVGGQLVASSQTPCVVPASTSTVRQHTWPLVVQRTPLSPQRTVAAACEPLVVPALLESTHVPSTHVWVVSQLTPTQSSV